MLGFVLVTLSHFQNLLFLERLLNGIVNILRKFQSVFDRGQAKLVICQRLVQLLGNLGVRKNDSAVRRRGNDDVVAITGD